MTVIAVLLATAIAAGQAPVTPAPVLVVPTGPLRLVASHSGKCLDAAGDPSRMEPATQKTCDGSAAQNWSVKESGTGYRIVSWTDARLCLNLRGATPAEGARVWVSTCSVAGQAGEIWSLRDVADGAVNIIARHSSKCLDVSQASAADGASILQFTCHGSRNEMWTLVRDGAPLPAAATPPGPRTTRPIAHIEHDGLSFSIAIDDGDRAALAIVIPEKSSTFQTSSRPIVRVRIVLRNDAVIEGTAVTNPPWVSNAGSVDVKYRFPLGRPLTEADIHSVTIWIGDQQFTVFPF